MTTQTVVPAAVGSSAASALARALVVESRKLFNTRTGVVLVGAAAVLAGAFAGGRALFPAPDTGFDQLASMASYPAAMITMVLAVLLVAGEFSARTASVSLVLDPRRGRLVLAKGLVVVGLSLVSTLLAFVCGALVVLVAPWVTGAPLGWTFSEGSLGIVAGNGIFLALAGAAWALALRNAPAPIAFLLVWPTVSLLIGSISAGAARVMGFVAVDPFFGLASGAEGAGWLGVVVSSLVWIVLPGFVGTMRLLRGDL